MGTSSYTKIFSWLVRDVYNRHDADLDLAKYLCSNIYSSTFVTFTRRVLRKYRNGRIEVDKLRIHQLATIRSGKSSISNVNGGLL